MLKKMFAIAGALATVSIPRLGLAQEQPANPNPSMQAPEGAYCPPGTTPMIQQAPQVQQQQPMVVEEQPPMHRRTYSPAQLSLTLGGGVGNFVRDRISDGNSSVAGTWDARILAGTRSYIGFEGTYQGTAAGGATDIGTGSVVTTQLSGALRLNATRKRIQPFVTAGAGWANLHRSVSSDLTAVGFSRTTNSFEVPFSGGIAGYIGQHGVLDVRGGYNLITNKDFTNTGARPDMWSAELRFGYAF